MTHPSNNQNNQNKTTSFFIKFIGTGLFSGYSPVASGTAGSAVALLFFLIPQFSNLIVLIPTIIIAFVLGGIAAEKLEKLYGQDPKQVTIDEVVGMWISMIGLALTWQNILAAFLIFRILDILKPYPAAYFDKKSGGWNIMLDDVIAGIYTNLILQIAIRFIPSFNL